MKHSVKLDTQVPGKAYRHLFTPCLLAMAIPTYGAWAEEPDTADTKKLDTVTVVSTGNRGAQRTVVDSPTPIDVISGEQLTKTGKTNLKDILGSLIPSFNFPSRNIGGSSWLVPGFTLRGLNGDQTLVLVNGKRRHNTAVMNNQARLANGASPVDLDQIPVSLIDHIEVLRDGASAQYGSDAIAGVINIILKTKDNGGTSDTTVGQYYAGDGFTVNQQTNYGLALPNDGFFNFSIDAKKTDRTYRNQAATAQLYNRLPNGQPDPREATADRHYYGKYYGNPSERTVTTGYNMELPLPNDLLFYSFSTLSYKEAQSYTGSVLPSSTRTLPEVFPDGYLGERGFYEGDFQVAGGVKGQLDEWAWDASSTYGQDHAQLNGQTGLAASLGPTSPTSFHLSTQIFDQWTNNLDFSRHYDIGLPKPLDVSVGVEHRWEQFEVQPGDPSGYTWGDYIIPAGQPHAGIRPGPGGGIYSALTPDDAGTIDRNSVAAYFDVGTNLTQRWYTGLAGRFEHYDDDSGNTAIGKLTTRYELNRQWAVRGTFNTGFRAPSLAQINYATTAATATVNADGSYNQFFTKLLRPGSGEAKALGAEPLKPEKSENISLGLVYQQSADLSVTLDAYQIKLTDRIVQTGLLTGTAVSQVLQANGFNPDLAGQYYTNGVDTRTRGVDLVSEYKQHLAAWGDIRWSAAYSWNKTTILDIADTPAQLASLGNTLLDRQKQADLTKAMPKDRVALGGLWSWRDFNVNVRLTRYGKYTEVSNLPINDRTFSAKWITDLDVSYDISKSVTVAVGANNIFDKYPDKIGVVSPENGAGQYGSFSPFGINGGFYYTKLQVRF
ncbi:MAG: TonB-dependent receptor [Pseudomonas sp.]|nr:TonB-dependent receptor [Pseudomonas sp.]